VLVPQRNRDFRQDDQEAWQDSEQKEDNEDEAVTHRRMSATQTEQDQLTASEENCRAEQQFEPKVGAYQVSGPPGVPLR
jgi:hypothetical protein